MYKKGQIVSMDVLFAFMIFLIAIAFLMALWESRIDRLVENNDRNHLETLSLEIADRLIRTGGFPVDWETDPNNLITIGLASNDRIIDEEKLEAFFNLDYNTTRNLLNTMGYEFYFEFAGFTKGIYPVSEEIIFTQRIAIYDNEAELMSFYLWERP
ncbi:hypothetical protein ACFLQN_03795 [Candidatus Aenigmatarchaeota archaeon]